MNFLEFYYPILILTFLFCSLFALIYFVAKYFKLKKSTFTESEITVTQYIIDSVITNYKNSYFSQKYERLLETYDLDKSSATNSFKRFNQEYENLLKESAKEIYSNHLSNNVKSICLKYFTIDGLLLHIISNLKEK